MHHQHRGNFPTDPGITISHVAGCLFVAHRNIANARGIVERIDRLILPLAGNAKDNAYAFLLELLDQRLTAVEIGHPYQIFLIKAIHEDTRRDTKFKETISAFVCLRMFSWIKLALHLHTALPCNHLCIGQCAAKDIERAANRGVDAPFANSANQFQICE